MIVRALFAFLPVLLVACSSGQATEAPDCEENPKAKGCKSSSATSQSGPSAPPTTTLPVATPPPSVQQPVDAGVFVSDAGHKPTPTQPNYACSDLVKCCAVVPDMIERATCLAIGYGSNASRCTNMLIAYQVAGGCSILGVATPASSSCDQLDEYCRTYGSATPEDAEMCASYYQNGC